MHGAWETFTGHHAPLKANPNIDFEDNLLLNLVRIFNLVENATHVHMYI